MNDILNFFLEKKCMYFNALTFIACFDAVYTLILL